MSPVRQCRDRAASFKVGGLTRSGYGGGVTSSREIFPFLVTNNASRAAKCVKSPQFKPVICNMRNINWNMEAHGPCTI